MTKDNNRVSFGKGEWVAIAAILVSIIGAWVRGELRHERTDARLTAIIEQHEYRLGRLETKVDGMEKP